MMNSTRMSLREQIYYGWRQYPDAFLATTILFFDLGLVVMAAVFVVFS